MTSSVIISKDALSFTNSNDIIVSKMESNSEGNIDISGILMGDLSGNLIKGDIITDGTATLSGGSLTTTSINATGNITSTNGGVNFKGFSTDYDKEELGYLSARGNTPLGRMGINLNTDFTQNESGEILWRSPDGRWNATGFTDFDDLQLILSFWGEC